MPTSHCANCAEPVPDDVSMCEKCVEVHQRRQPYVRGLQISIAIMLCSLVVAFVGSVTGGIALTFGGFGIGFVSGLGVLCMAYLAIRPINGR